MQDISRENPIIIETLSDTETFLALPKLVFKRKGFVGRQRVLHLLSVARVDAFVILAEAEFTLDSLTFKLFRIVRLVAIEVIRAVLTQRK